MAIVSMTLPRIFSFKENGHEIKLSDPDPAWEPDAVLNYYMPVHPILANAKIHKPVIKDDEQVFEFSSTIGTKG